MSNFKLLTKNLSLMSIDDLINKRIFFKKELFKLRFQKVLGEFKTTHRFIMIKKNIARINTVLNFKLKSYKNA